MQSLALVRSSCSSLALLGLLALPAPAQLVKKLNADLPRTVIGGVQSFKLSSDGAWVVYRSDEVTDELFELYSVPSNGSQAPLQLSATMVAGGDLSGLPAGFQISPDSSFVAYLADQDTDEVSELFVVPIDGSSTPLKLSGLLVAGGDVVDFQISPDSTRIVYRADADTDDVYELYQVPSDGSQAPVKLSGTLVAGGDVLAFALGAGSTRVVYLADQHSDQRNELYGVPIDASLPAQRLNEALDAGENVDAFRIAADESRVVYHADQAANDVFELFSVPSDGSAAPLRLNGTLVPAGDVQDFEISSDSLRVVYRADQDTNDLVELFSAPLDGSQAAVRLYAPARATSAFRLRPGGQDVLFLADLDTAAVVELYRVPSAGGVPPSRLNATLFSWQDVIALEISSDDQRVLYTRESTQFNPYGGVVGVAWDLFSVPVTGGSALKLNHDYVTDASLTVYGAITPAGQHVLYEVENFGIFSVPIDGSLAAVRVTYDAEFRVTDDDARIVYRAFASPSAPFALTSSGVRGENRVTLSGQALLGAVIGDVLDFQMSADGLQIVYRVGSGSNAALYVVSPGGLVPPRLVTDPADESGAVFPGASYWISPDSRRLLYLRRDPVSTRLKLESVPLRSRAAPLQLDPNAHGIFAELSVRPIFTPDGKSVVYATRTTRQQPDLFVMPVDGSASPLELSGPFPESWEGLWVSEARPGVQISPDGGRVVYAAYLAGRYGIFSVPIDRSSEPVLLNGVLPSWAEVYGNFAITPDGGRVLYLAEQEVQLRTELYSAHIDGSSAAIKLNGALVSGGAVGAPGTTTNFGAYVQITPDGSRAIYRADQELDNRHELYSVPTDGSAPPVKLNGTLVTGGDVDPHPLISPDGTRVVYRADQTTDEVYELYSVPLDGSAPAVRISGTLVAGGDVLGSQAPCVFAGGLVVFQADKDTNDVVELYSVPLDGSAPPLKLSAAMPSGGDVLADSFFAGPVGGLVYYRADQQSDEVVELFVVPADGSAAPLVLNGALVNGGDVQSAPRVTPNGRAVIYRADQDSDQDFELYSNQSPHPPRGPLNPPAISGTVTRSL